MGNEDVISILQNYNVNAYFQKNGGINSKWPWVTYLMLYWGEGIDYIRASKGLNLGLRPLLKTEKNAT